MGGLYLGVAVEMTLNLMGSICLTERELMVGLVPGISFSIVVELVFSVAEVVNIGIGAEGKAINARLECPITLILKNGVGIRVEVDFVLLPPNIRVYGFVEAVCGVYLVGLTFCGKDKTLLEVSIGDTVILPILSFEVLPPDYTPPSAGIVTLTQLTTDQLTVSWTGFTEEETEVRQFEVHVKSSTGAVALSVLTSGTEEEYSGSVSSLPATGARMTACVTATNIANLKTYVCSEVLIWDVSSPKLSQLWLRQTLTGKWIQPCCIGNANCGSYSCTTPLPSNASNPEFMVELEEWPPSAKNNISMAKWTIRNVPMEWVDEDFEDLGFENILSSVWALNCSAQAWGCLNGKSTLLSISSDNLWFEEGLQYITVMACDSKDNCAFLHSSPLLIDHTPPQIMQIFPQFTCEAWVPTPCTFLLSLRKASFPSPSPFLPSHLIHGM